MSLAPVPKMKPRKAPRADLREVAVSFFETTSSATNAPMSEPTIIPTGGTTRPANRPMMAPQPPALEPPVSFVKYAGTT